MTIDDAAEGLAEADRLAPVRKRVAAADAVGGMPLGALAERARSSRAYGTEPRTAGNLFSCVRVERAVAN
ncbi:hypothetical protein [Palleronia rufa]|uniref:hypothetical protein n=1 Tax=Palleronia rufa TaxID=1530186 RepID=UPI00055BCC69|nr:hypothetical protein [Palleronia rufa]